MPVTPTYDLIASNVLSSSASSVTFSSIPATYRDLVLAITATSTGAITLAGIRFNGDSGTNYSQVYAEGTGSSAQTSSSSGVLTYASIGNSGYPASTAAIFLVNIFDYSATDKHKSLLSRANNASNGTGMLAARWANTAAINSVELVATENNFASGSSFYLYGIVS